MFEASDVLTAKVLIVDDRQANVRLLERMLGDAGYTSVTSTMDPHQVCDLHRRDRYDLILLDLEMPGMDGFQVMRDLREVEPKGFLPVLVMTAHPEHKLRALQAGARDFISQPFDQIEVLTRIHNMLEVRLLLGESKRRAEGIAGRLLESEEEYRLLFECNPHPMWVFDVETLAFLAVNAAAVRLYGFSREEFLGMTIREIRPLEEVPALVEYVPTMSDAPSLPAVHVKHRKKDGSLLEVVGVSNPIEFHGRHARLVLANDVSEKNRLEAQLLHAQKMDAVGRLAGGVAHDFNNMLGVIIGYGELALRQLGIEHPVRARVDQMVKAAERAAGLTRQLLAFSRRQVLQPKLLDLNTTIAYAEKMLGRLINEDIEIVLRLGPRIGTVMADLGQIEQIVLNLAVNARDAMPKGGSLTLETANADLDSEYAAAHPSVPPGRYVMLAVSDTGVGMDAGTQAHIFEPFFTTKPEGQGTGLGLATVYGIVKQSGGHIWVYSELGRGTTFKVYLPRVDELAASPGPAAPSLEAPRGHETILLVEDTETLREVIRETLEESGYTVLLASNGEDALALSRERALPIDLLLTDVVMPRLGGGDLGRLLLALRPGLRVLYMSGYSDGAISQQGVLGEGVMLLEKPFSVDKLARAVRAALDA